MEQKHGHGQRLLATTIRFLSINRRTRQGRITNMYSIEHEIKRKTANSNPEIMMWAWEKRIWEEMEDTEHGENGEQNSSSLDSPQYF